MTASKQHHHCHGNTTHHKNNKATKSQGQHRDNATHRLKENPLMP